MRDARNEAAFSIIEVVVSALLLTTVGATILRSFINASRWSNPVGSTSVYSLRGNLDQLAESVRSDTWDSPSNPLSLGTHNSTVTLDGKTHTQSYVVTSVKLDGVNEAYRKVAANDHWD